MRGVVFVAADVVRGKVADGILVVAAVVVIEREVRGSKRGRNLVVDAMVSVISSSGSVLDTASGAMKRMLMESDFVG